MRADETRVEIDVSASVSRFFRAGVDLDTRKRGHSRSG
jgi:hypothetical protein